MSRQLRLFELDTEQNKPDALSLLRNGAVLVLSVSGRKDSDAMSHYLLDVREREDWTGDIYQVANSSDSH